MNPSMLGLFLTEAQKHLATLQNVLATGQAEQAIPALNGIRANARLAGPAELAGLIAYLDQTRDAFATAGNAVNALSLVQEAALRLQTACGELASGGVLLTAFDAPSPSIDAIPPLAQPVPKPSPVAEKTPDNTPATRSSPENSAPGNSPQPADDAGCGTECQATRAVASSHSAKALPLTVAIEPIMLEMFRSEAEERLNTLNEQILRLEENPADATRLEELMRAAHSLKGAARIIGMQPVVTLAHALEDYFVAAQKGELTIRPERADILLSAVDGLGRLCTGSEQRPEPYLAQLATLAPNAPAASISSAPAAPEASSPAPQPREKPRPFCEPLRAEAMQTGAAGAAATGKWIGAHHETPDTEQAAPLAAASLAAPPITAVPSAGAKTAFNAPTDPADGVVRVSAGSISRIMGLAGETVVQSQSMETLSGGIRQLRRSVERQLDLLDKLQLCADCANAPLLQQLREATVRTRELLQRGGNEVDGLTRHAAELSGRLYREVLGSRMRPFREGIQGFERMVRDLARQLGKRVKFEILGLDTRVDRDVLAKLEAPLTHLLRNAVDHGMQTPEERAAAGKPEENRLVLQALHWAGFLTVRISDDGKGMDPDMIRRKIREKGLHDPTTLPQLTQQELLEFLFLPGFSTAQAVTEISGRGVGLDVVREMLRTLGGQVQVENRHGHGMTFHLRLPVTRSVARVLLVQIAGEAYALPLNRIDRLLRLAPTAIRHLEGRAYVQDDADNIGLVDAAHLLGVGSAQTDGRRLPVVVVRTGEALRGLIVDAFLGERELVVKPLDPRLGKVRDINALMVLDDGQIVLLLDVDDLATSLHGPQDAGALPDHPSSPALAAFGQKAALPSRCKKNILVVDDSLTVREMERRLLEGAGYTVTTAVDGVDGWLNARAQTFDLLISDIDMPRMTGLELVQTLRADPQFARLPVLLVSYKDRPEDRAAGQTAGANGYVTKGGFQDGDFLRSVEQLLSTPLPAPR